jgi:hypothetical protein
MGDTAPKPFDVPLRVQGGVKLRVIHPEEVRTAWIRAHGLR